MEFVDRIEEQQRLIKTLNSEKPTFIVVYGRRRLGKSTLIKKVITPNDVYYMADQTERAYQISLLAKEVGLVFPDFDKVIYPDWQALLTALNHRTQKRFTLCLDEFPYLVKSSPELPALLQRLIDSRSLKYNLIICGSSQQLMQGLILDGSAPLYGRADQMLKLSPIHIKYLQEVLHSDAVSTIEEYAVWGGVPRYWELRENRNSLSDALWHNILSINGTLYEEPIKLFQDDVKDIVKTSTIMSYIGSGANRLSEIAARCNEPATNLSRPLKKLIDLGFLEKDVPFGIDEKNAKKSLYKIADPFMAFYYQFVVPNRSFIELGRRLPLEQALAVHFPEYVSMHWEKLCRDAVTGNMVNGIVYGKAKRWWGPVLNERKEPEQIEIDVMAESLDKKYLLVGECKWTNLENGKQLTAELLRKANLLPFAKNYNILPVLFLKNAPKDDVGNAMLPESVVGLMK